MIKNNLKQNLEISQVQQLKLASKLLRKNGEGGGAEKAPDVEKLKDVANIQDGVADQTAISPNLVQEGTTTNDLST